LDGRFGVILGLLAKSFALALVGAATFGMVGLIADCFFPGNINRLKSGLRLIKSAGGYPVLWVGAGVFIEGAGGTLQEVVLVVALPVAVESVVAGSKR